MEMFIFCEYTTQFQMQEPALITSAQTISNNKKKLLDKKGGPVNEETLVDLFNKPLSNWKWIHWRNSLRMGKTQRLDWPSICFLNKVLFEHNSMHSLWVSNGYLCTIIIGWIPLASPSVKSPSGPNKWESAGPDKLTLTVSNDPVLWRCAWSMPSKIFSLSKI